MYGSVHLEGMEFNNMYTLLGAIHISLVTQFFKTDTNLGRLIETLLEFLTIELGLPQCYFSYNYIKYSDCATKSWMKN